MEATGLTTIIMVATITASTIIHTITIIQTVIMNLLASLMEEGKDRAIIPLNGTTRFLQALPEEEMAIFQKVPALIRQEEVPPLHLRL
jgi:hypothetical protein